MNKKGLRVRYSTIDFPDFDIHVRSLWDLQQFSDDQGVARKLGISSAQWPLFGTLWAAGRVLARIMAARDVDGLRILEVGCGLGLSSLVLNHRRADVTATDHHPEVPRFLDANTALNGDPPIVFVRTGWKEPHPSLGSFDLIIGADLLYDDHQMADLAGFMRRHCEVGGEVLIVDPGRRARSRFRQRMAGLGFVGTSRLAEEEETADNDCGPSHVLGFGLPHPIAGP